MEINYRSEEFIRYLENRIARPFLIIEICSVCNFKCAFCINRFNYRKKSLMPEELFYHIARQLPQIPGLVLKLEKGKIPDFSNTRVQLHADGEPMLHPKFYDFVKKLHDFSIPVLINTNGSRLRKEFLDLQLITTISISISEKEFALRTDQIDFKDYMERIKDYVRGWLNSDCKQRLYIQLHVDDQDVAQDGLEKVGKEKWDFISNFAESVGINKPLVERTNIKKNIWRFSYYHTKGNGATLVFFSRPIDRSPTYSPLREDDEHVSTGFCTVPWLELKILSDGRIGFCCADLTGKTAIINSDQIWKKPLMEIWTNSIMAKVRKSFKGGNIPIGICQRCLAGVPNHTCYTRLDDLTGIDI